MRQAKKISKKKGPAVTQSLFQPLQLSTLPLGTAGKRKIKRGTEYFHTESVRPQGGEIKGYLGGWGHSATAQRLFETAVPVTTSFKVLSRLDVLGKEAKPHVHVLRT